jgi:hypothetical protein
VRHPTRVITLLGIFVLLSSGQALTTTSQEIQPAKPSEETRDDPTKGSKDINEVVEYPIAKVLEAAKQALATYGCEIKKEKPDYLECTRSRHIGAFVGSGGEKVTVQLSSEGDRTKVIIKTGKGFVGRLGKKNWSTPTFNEIVRILKSA